LSRAEVKRGYLGWEKAKAIPKFTPAFAVPTFPPKEGGKDGAPASGWLRLESLLHAALLQPGAIFLAGYSGVGGEPFAQVFDQFVDAADVAVLIAGVELGEAA
jgi:hypothetical protein